MIGVEEISSVPFEFRVDAWLLVAGLAIGYEWALRNLGPRLSGFDVDELTSKLHGQRGGDAMEVVA